MRVKSFSSLFLGLEVEGIAIELSLCFLPHPLLKALHFDCISSIKAHVHFPASTPAPHQSSSSDCPPGQVNTIPADHPHVEPVGDSTRAKDEQSVNLRVECCDLSSSCE